MSERFSFLELLNSQLSLHTCTFAYCRWNDGWLSLCSITLQWNLYSPPLCLIDLLSLYPYALTLHLFALLLSYHMAAQDGKASPEIWLLQLTDDGAPDVPSGYIYLPPPTDPAYILRFEIEGTSSVCRQGSLWVNIPAPGEPFRRDQYRQHT